MKRPEIFLAALLSMPVAFSQQLPGSGGLTDQEVRALLKMELSPKTAFPLTADEERLLPALKHHTRSKELFVPFAFKDPMDKNVALVGAGFNLDAKGRIHMGNFGRDFVAEKQDTYTYNGRARFDPPAERLWKIADIPEDLLTLRKHAVSNQIARLYLAGAKLTIPKEAKISERSAEILFDLSIRQAMYNASCYFKHWQEFTPFQKIAVADMVYQLGIEFAEFKLMLGRANQNKPLNDKDWADVQAKTRIGHWVSDYPDRAPDNVAMMSLHFTPKTQHQKSVKALIPADLLPPEPPTPPRMQPKTHPRIRSAPQSQGRH